MENREIAKELKSLCQLDIDAIHAYNETLHHLDLKEVKNTVEKFKGDHERHVKDLSALIRSLGEEPPSFKPDIKGYMLDVFTKIRSLTGNEGAIKSLKSGEDLTNKRYGEAVKKAFPANIKEIVQRNFRDEERHLHYIEQAIKDQVWKKAA